MSPSRRQWLLALAVAVMLHVGLALGVLWQTPRSGAQSAGAGGLEVSLGPAGGAPGSVQVEAPETAETQPAAETPAELPPETTEAEAAGAVAPAVSRPEPAEPAPRVAAPEPAEVTRATEAPPPEEVLALAETPPEPEPEPVEASKPEPEVTAAQPPEREPEPEPEPQPETVEATEPEPEPEPAPEVTAEPEPTETAPAATPQAAEDVPERETVSASEAGSGGEGDTRDSREQGSGDDSAAGGAAGAQADYIAALRAWLERHKEYPRRARMRRQEGVAVLRFVVARDGEVLEYALAKGSGHAALDREVEAMIRRASPLPAMPDGMNRERLELVVPVQFSLR